jgi:hypothetical protein
MRVSAAGHDDLDAIEGMRAFVAEMVQHLVFRQLDALRRRQSAAIQAWRQIVNKPAPRLPGMTAHRLPIFRCYSDFHDPPAPLAALRPRVSRCALIVRTTHRASNTDAIC